MITNYAYPVFGRDCKNEGCRRGDWSSKELEEKEGQFLGKGDSGGSVEEREKRMD